MEFATEKWGGIPHYRGTVELAGEDEFGAWWWGARGRPIYRGEQQLFVAEQDVVFLVPRDAWWSATWWFDHPEVELYVNIGTVAVVEEARVVSTDLDLDVIRWNDGRCEIVDRDEFEAHQVAYGYPPDVIAVADATATEVLDRMRRDEPPFDGAAARAWAARFR